MGNDDDTRTNDQDLITRAGSGSRIEIVDTDDDTNPAIQVTNNNSSG